MKLRRKMRNTLSVLALFCFQILNINAQTIGNTIYKEDNQEGFILFNTLSSNNTYLIDKCGRVIQQWSSEYLPGVSCKIGKDGKLYRTGSLRNEAFLNGGGNGGLIEIFSLDGKKEATYIFSDINQVQHHDIYVMNNGNILLVQWQIKTREECLEKGKDTSQMNQITSNKIWFEKVIEIKPIDSINYDVVWEWEAFNHTVQDKFPNLNNFDSIHKAPERIDINYNPNDNPQTNFIHINSIDYNEELDQIILSARLFDEIWVIDHSTTTEEAKTNEGGNSGKGGGIIYRWGNPFAYKSGTLEDRKLFKQHHAHWIKNNTIHKGNIIIFNNGIGRKPVNYSSVEIIEPPVNGFDYDKESSKAFDPKKPYFSFEDTMDYYFFASFVSGATILENGNLFVTDGPIGRAFEVNDKSEICWEYISPLSGNNILSQGQNTTNNPVFRFEFYNKDYEGFANNELSPSDVIEKEPLSPLLCQKNSSIPNISILSNSISIYPNPSEGTLQIKVTANNQSLPLSILNLQGQIVYKTMIQEESSLVNLTELSKGVYFLKIGNHCEKIILH